MSPETLNPRLLSQTPTWVSGHLAKPSALQRRPREFWYLPRIAQLDRNVRNEYPGGIKESSRGLELFGEAWRSRITDTPGTSHRDGTLEGCQNLTAIGASKGRRSKGLAERVRPMAVWA